VLDHRKLSAILVAALLAGCNSQMGDVHGKITYQGKPVPVGSVLFVPKVPKEQFEAGKPASGAPNAAGEFQLSTFRQNDGALVGPHTVTYMAPQLSRKESPDYEERLKLVEQYGKLGLPKDYIIDVKPGRNDIVLELSEQ